MDQATNPSRARAGLVAAAFLLVTLVSGQDPPNDGTAPDDLETAKSRESRASRVYLPRPAVPEPERLERLRIEQELERRALAPKDADPPRDNTAVPAAPAIPDPIALARVPAEVAREARGTLHEDLQLSLISEPHAKPAIPGGLELTRGRPILLRLVLHNLAAEARRLESVPACGSLERADSIEFHVDSDGGERLVLPNAYVDIESAHEHRPLEIPPNGQLDGVFDFAELVHSSFALESLLERSRRITVVAAIPAIHLESRPVEIQVAPRSAGQVGRP